MLCEGLAAGEGIEESARHTSVALHLGSKGEANLELLVQWGVEFGIFTGTGSISLADDIQASVEALAGMPVEGMTSQAEARLYISTVLGRDAFDELDEVDRGLLAKAVTECDSDPFASVEASGQALEDYLRELCGRHDLAFEASKLNGAGQLANLLQSHDLIHPHHVKLVDSASMLRNAKAHKKDKKTVAPWIITSRGARTAFGTTVTAIGSISEWVSNGRQIL